MTEGRPKGEPPPSMLVPVMDIRIVRMRVFERVVNVRVGVRLFPVPLGPMLMLMMLIMRVRVFVLHADVRRRPAASKYRCRAAS